MTVGRISRRAFVTTLGGLALAGKESWATETDLPFLVVGDWGTGSEAQKKIAGQMGKTAAAIGARFVISTGDNFYPKGVRSGEDAQWIRSFEEIYTAQSLGVPWYAVLGNHDHKGNISAQINYTTRSSRWRMPSRYYRHTETLDRGAQADFFFIDSDAIRRHYETWSRQFLRNDQVAWLERELAASTARWKVVVGHHPVFSGGLRRDGTPALIKWLRPLLDRHGVHAYLAGHSHTLEHIVVGDVHYLISGAGALSRRSRVTPNTRFQVGNQLGFLVVRLSSRALAIEFIDDAGHPLYGTRI